MLRGFQLSTGLIVDHRAGVSFLTQSGKDTTSVKAVTFFRGWLLFGGSTGLDMISLTLAISSTQQRRSQERGSVA